MIRNVVSTGALITLMVMSFISIGNQGVPWYTADHWLQLTLVVRDADGLIPASRVLLRGVPIGEVLAVAPDADKVAVRIRYDNTIRLPQDSSFRIENLSALGETYLSIKPSRDDGPVLENDQRVIADAQTVQGTIGEAAVAVARLFAAIDTGRVNRIINELNTALSDDLATAPLADGSSRLEALVTSHDRDIRDVFTNSQALLHRANARAPALATLGDSARIFSSKLRPALEGAIRLVFHSGVHFPFDLQNGALQLLTRILKLEDDIGPNIYNLTEPLLPVMQATAAAMSTIDTSRLLDSAIESVAMPGAFTVHVIPSR